MNLRTLYQSLTVEERVALAAQLPTDPGYLWQLATQWRGKRPSIGLMRKLVAADARLTLHELVEEFAGSGEKPAPSATPAPPLEKQLQMGAGLRPEPGRAAATPEPTPRDRAIALFKLVQRGFGKHPTGGDSCPPAPPVPAPGTDWGTDHAGREAGPPARDIHRRLSRWEE